MELENGYRAEIEIERDDDMGEPWEEHDGHGPVSEWERREKRPYERILCSDRGAHRFYDMQEALKIAKRDGWDAPPYRTGTKGEQAARAGIDRNEMRRVAICNGKPKARPGVLYSWKSFSDMGGPWLKFYRPEGDAQ